MNNNMTAFDKFIRDKASIAKQRIGIGIINPDHDIIDSLLRANEFCNVVAFGQDIINIESVVTGAPEESLVKSLKSGEIDAVIRGQASATVLRSYMVEMLGYKHKDIKDLALIRDNFDRVFAMCPVAHRQGWTVAQKIELIREAADFVQLLELPVKVGVTSGARPEELAGNNRLLNQTYEDAEKIVELLECELPVKHYYIDIQSAVADHCTILVMANGMVGNHVLRSLTFLGRIKTYGGIISGINELVVESFRNAPGFYEYLEFTSALANLRSIRQPMV